MSLEEIDRYIRELEAIRDYSTKCLKLNEAYSYISELHKELESQKKIISILRYTIREQVSTIMHLGNKLKETQEAVNNPGKEAVPTDQLGEFVWLDFRIDAPRFVSRKTMKAICLWLLENRYLSV